jgi:hypothetical protein
MSADAFIQFRVTPEVKTLLRALAQREQISESALVRQLVETMLRTQAQVGFPPLAEMDRSSRDARVCVFLDEDDRIRLMNRALQRGMRSATYLAVLARAHLRGVAPLPKEEFLALKRSIAELGAIGRNLNQMARALNQDARAHAPGRNEVAAMLKVCEGLRDHFKALLKGNEKSWLQGYAETTH